MKKVSIFIITFCIALFFINAQSITVTSPSAGDAWLPGSTHDITWTKTGDMNGFVKIRLFDLTGRRVLNIVDRTANNRLYRDWTIPAGISPGEYTIRVRTVDSLVDDHSEVFTISGSGPEITPEIDVTSPSRNYNRGSRLIIRWTKVGEMDSRVKIELLNNSTSAVVLVIIANTNNDGEHPWDIPGTQSTGAYRVKVSTIAGGVRDESSTFQITAAPTMTLPENMVVESRRVIPGSTQPVIKVIYPNGGETLTRGSRVEIRWECVDGFNPPRIKIQKNGRTVKTYGPSGLYPVPSGDGYIYPWIIPSDLAPGSDYKVRIEKGDFSRSNDKSDNNFAISSDLNIEVTEPRGSGLVATNGTFIRWRAGGVEGNVNVHLKRADDEGTRSLQLIRSNIPATPSSFLWYVGHLLHSGIITHEQRYKVVVTAADGSASGESNSFQIMKPNIDISSPGSSEKRRGDTININWRGSAGFHGNVDVILEKQTGSTWVAYETLFTNTHDTSLSWRIPPGPRAGEGQIDPFPTGVRFRVFIKSVRCPHLVVARSPWFMVR